MAFSKIDRLFEGSRFVLIATNYLYIYLFLNNEVV